MCFGLRILPQILNLYPCRSIAGHGVRFVRPDVGAIPAEGYLFLKSEIEML